MKILLIDDEYRGSYTQKYLTYLGYVVDWVNDASKIDDSIFKEYDILILDIMLLLSSDSKYICQYFDNHQWLNSGLHILIYIREKMEITHDKLKIVLYSARSEQEIKN